MYRHRQQLIEWFKLMLSQNYFHVSVLTEKPYSDSLLWYSCMQLSQIINASEINLEKQINKDDNINIVWRFAICSQKIQVFITFFDECYKNIDFSRLDLDIEAICRELNKNNKFQRENIKIQIMNKTKKQFKLAKQCSLRIIWQLKFQLEFALFSKLAKNGISNLCSIIISIWVYIIQYAQPDKSVKLSTSVSENFPNIIREIVSRQSKHDFNEIQEYLNKNLITQPNLTNIEVQKQQFFDKIKQSSIDDDPLIQIQNPKYKVLSKDKVFVIQIRYQQLLKNRKVLSSNKQKNFIIEMIQLDRAYLIKSITNPNQDKFFTKQKTIFMHVRVPNDKEIEAMHKANHKSQIQKLKFLYHKSMKKTIQNILSLRFYPYRRPKVYLIQQQHQIYTAQCNNSGFLMSYCGQKIDKFPQMSCNEMFYARLSRVVSVGLTLHDIQQHGIINGDFNVRNFRLFKEKPLLACITNFQQTRIVQNFKKYISFDRIIIKQQQKQKFLQSDGDNSKMKILAGLLSGTQQQSLESISVVQILKKILRIINSTEQAFKPHLMKQLQTKIKQFLLKFSQDNEMQINQKEVNILRGWQYDFQGYVEIINSMVLRYFPYPFNINLGKRYLLALERLSLLVQIVEQKLKKMNPNQFISIKKIIIFLEVIKNLATPFDLTQ